MQRLDRATMTCPSTPHYVVLEVVLPGNVILEPRPIVLRPVRTTVDGKTKYSFSAVIKARHPPCFGKKPYKVELDTIQSYHQDGRIDETSIRVVVMDPTLNTDIIDLTKEVSSVKLEEEHKDHSNTSYSSDNEERKVTTFDFDVDFVQTPFLIPSYHYT